MLRVTHHRVPEVIRSVGILETAAIGDTTLLSAVLLDLRDAFPHCRITLFAGNSNVAVARLLGGHDEVICLPVKNVFEACRLVRKQHFDLFLDYGPWPRINGVISYFARAKYKVGFRTRGQHRHFVYDLPVVHSPGQHELENFRDVLRAIGVPTIHAPQFPSSVGRSDLPGQYQVRDAYVVFHLWPGGYRAAFKEWPVERWLEIGKQISKLGFQIVLTGAPSDHARNQSVIARAETELSDGGWKNFAGASMEQTIGIIRRSRLTVSVNTGVMHVAAVLGAPVLGLHGPTSERRWGPIGPLAVAIRAPGPECGYLNLGFEYPVQCTCMERITVDHVMAQCMSLLAGNTRVRRDTAIDRSVHD